jgi:DNA-binding MarR family transcriptional regulator
MDVNAKRTYDGDMTAETSRAPGRAAALAADPIGAAREQWVAHGWEDAAPGMAAITSLMRAHQIALARVEATLKPLGVSFARYEVLMLLLFSKRGSLPMKLIASRLQVHPTSVTNAVDRLEAAGLVTRQADPDDRRALIITLTPEGRAVAEKATAALNTEVFSAPGLSGRDVEQLIGILGRLRREAGDF